MPFEEIRKGLAHLHHDRHEILAVQIVDRHEEDFPFQTWCRLRGLEGESGRVLEPALARHMYLDNFRRHRRLLQEASLGLRIHFEHTTTDRPLLECIKLLLSRR
jgi:hypothetical protein